MCAYQQQNGGFDDEVAYYTAELQAAADAREAERLEQAERERRERWEALFANAATQVNQWNYGPPNSDDQEAFQKWHSWFPQPPR